MAVNGVGGAGGNVRVQNAQADKQAAEAKAQNDQRQAQAAKEQEARRPQTPVRGQNTDVMV
jgi:hypothetical protein